MFDRARLPKVSVIIPTYNSAATISKCLDSLVRQTYKPIEILVVDNQSNDTTICKVRNYDANVLIHSGNRSSSRNLGVKASTGEFVMFLDSDQYLGTKAVEECIEKEFEAESMLAVKVPEVFVGDSLWGRASAFWKNTVGAVEGSDGGIPRFYSRELIANNLSFNEKMVYWEDYELLKRFQAMGGKCACANTKIMHDEPRELSTLIRKSVKYGSHLIWQPGQSFIYIRWKITTLKTLTHLVGRAEPRRLVLPAIFVATLKALAMLIGFVFVRFRRRKSS